MQHAADGLQVRHTAAMFLKYISHIVLKVTLAITKGGGGGGRWGRKEGDRRDGDGGGRADSEKESADSCTEKAKPQTSVTKDHSGWMP